MVSSELAWEMIDQKNPKTILLSPVASMGFLEWEVFLK
jgi:hypothetical protein